MKAKVKLKTETLEFLSILLESELFDLKNKLANPELRTDLRRSFNTALEQYRIAFSAVNKALHKATKKAAQKA